MSNARREQAIRVYASQFDMAPEDVPDELYRLFGARMAEESMVSMGGSAWDATLPRRDRSLIVLSALIAQGGVEDRLRTHIGWALRNDVSEDELDALVSMLAIYVGYPRAVAAMAVLKDEIANIQQSTVDNPPRRG